MSSAKLVATALYLLLWPVLLILGLEEALLVKELDGYEDYRRRVRWRLVPHLW